MAVKGRTKSSKSSKSGKKAKPAAPKKKGAAKAKAPARKPPAAKPAARRSPQVDRRTQPRDRAWKSIQTLRKALEQSGKPLTHWIDILDRVGGPDVGHTTLVRVLTETQKVAPWPANCIVLHYRGLYGFGENSNLVDHQDQLDLLGPWK